jgi:tetratricopeptide (TPR) repeat protein
LGDSFYKTIAQQGDIELNNLAPIGVFTYSRINHLRQTIEALKNNTLARESELYIFSDAAKPGDEDKILEVREYIHGINGFKIVKLIERETNGYLKNARDGIRQLLNVYGRCIIMEDDNVTAPGFLRFMNEALNFYKNDDRIFSICGYCPPIKIPPDYNSDVFILRRFSAWGYGVWNDSYKKISYLDNAEVLGRFSNKREVEELSKYGEDLLNMILLDAAGKMDAFDVKIFYHQFLNEKYTIYPKKSLVRNIGLDGSGMHCSKTNKFDVDLWDKLDFEISGKVKLDNRIVKSNYIFRQIGKNNKFMENTNTSTRGNILERGKLGENLIFLISQPRAGSTLLQRILSGHSDIYTTAEPWIMLHPLYALKEKGLSAEFDSNLARQGLEDFTSQVPEGKDLYIEALRQMGGKLYDRVLAVSGKQIFLDKTPRYYLIIPELKKIFPEAKFIILLRNPLAVLSSTLKTWFQNNPANLQKSQNYIDVIQGPLYLIQGIQLLKEDAIVVKYEELVEDAENSVKAISNKLGIAFQQEMLTYGAKPKPKGRFGDAVGVAKHDKAVPYYIDKWVENLQSSQLYEFSLKYMEALGPDIFNLMGYSYTETKSKLERLEDVAYHGVEIKEDPISIKQKETDKESIKSVGMKNNAEERILVSAIVSTYNSQRFISGRLEDLENQTIADRLEIVVVNSGSQQNEEKIIKEFQEKYSNIKYIKTNQRETVYAAWNRGIEASQGKYITSANTDDRLRQDAFEVMVNTLEASPEIALVYADVIITETENETFERCTPVGNFKWLNFSRDDLLNKGCFVGPQPMWRREVHDEYGFFDASFVTSGDYEFWLRISQSNTFMHLPVQLGLYLRSPGSIEHSNREKQREENRKILDMYRKARSCGKIIRRLQGSTSAGDTEPRSENMKSPETIYRNIQTEIGNKQPEEIISEMEMLAASYPEFALAHNDLGVLHYHAGNKEKAHQSYEKAVQLDSENMVFQKNLADFYYVELGRVEDALRIYVKILEANPEDVETLLITGHICVSLHKFEDAQAFYRRVLALEPLNEAAQKNLGKLSRKGPIQSELKPAEDMYQEIQPLLNNGDAHKAIASLTGLLERFPDFELAHNDLGVLYYHTGDKEKAQFHYERAVELMPDNINFQKNLADFYCIELGRIEDALKIYVRILTTDPQDVETLMATGQICKAFEKHDDARDFFNQVLQIEPWNADARKQIEEMERQLSGVSLNSESAEDAYRRLQESLNTLTPEEAIVELEKLVESYPDFAVGHNELAVLYYNTGNKEKSLRYYQQAAHLQPENMTLQKNLADFLFVELGKVDDALQIYVDLLTTHPDDVDTLLITGHICVALKKFDDAKDYYERVVALEPGNQDANNYLQALTNRQNGRSSARPDVLNDVTVSSAKAESTDLNSEESENQDAQPQPTVSIFISLDGIQNRVKQCIQSISAHTEEPHEIILINSGATKGVLKWAQNLTQDNTHYQLVKCDKMHSWAQGLNQAVKAAAGDYIVLMHNDVIVADRWLPGMLQCFRAGSGTGIVGPMTNATSGIQKAYFSEERDPNRLEPDAKAFYAQNQHRRISTTQLASFFLMFRHELIDKIGDFDAHLVSEQAVVADFCKRSAAWGFQNLVAGDVFVYHADRHKDSRKTADAVQVPAEDQKRLKENWNKMKGDRRFLKSTHMMSLLETVNKLHQGGYVDQAVEALLNAIGALPEETRLYLALAEISISLKRYQDAIDTLNEMPDDAKTEMDSEETGNLNEPGLQSPSLVISENHEMKTLEILGYAEEGLENFAAAETYADRMLAIDPKSARALNLKGILAYRKEDPNSAEQFFEKSVASGRRALFEFSYREAGGKPGGGSLGAV